MTAGAVERRGEANRVVALVGLRRLIGEHDDGDSRIPDYDLEETVVVTVPKVRAANRPVLGAGWLRPSKDTTSRSAPTPDIQQDVVPSHSDGRPRRILSGAVTFDG